jgi:molecular chaperone DnaJ
MSKRDYYEVLNVARNASEAEVKQAYRRLAMKLHPDRNPGDQVAEERFKEAKEAYEVLSDSRKRTAYDQFGHAGWTARRAVASAASARPPTWATFSVACFRDISGGMRGGGGGQKLSRGRPALHPGFDAGRSGIRHHRQDSRADAGLLRDLRWQRRQARHQATTCPTCRGAGQVRMQQGFFSIQQACPRCQGRGTIIPDPCETCRGSGRIEEQKTLSVKVPAGVDNGDRIRLTGEGEVGEHGGSPGDLYVQIQVKPHPIFTREDNNLYCEVPIGFHTAALGGELEVPTLDGRLSLKIPPETQTSKVFRLRGKGVKPVRGGPTGDLLCRIVVETPVNLTREQKELLEKFAATMEASGERHTPQQGSWLDGVKKFFEDMKF